MNVTGTFQTAARLIPSLKAPEFTAPSPKKAATTRASPFFFTASPIPAAIGMLLPTIAVASIRFFSFQVATCIEPPIPPQVPSTLHQLGEDPVERCPPCDRVPMSPV